MKKFLKYCLLFAIPSLLFVGTYIIFDPFKVLRHYDNYYVVGDGGELNRNYVSTMNYLNKKDIYHYDSFIFGNSRSKFYLISDWKKHIPSQSVCYHFSENGGSVNGIYYKVKLLDEQNENIKNALLVIDHQLLQRTEQDGAIGIMPPILKGNRNILQFHLEHFAQWANLKYQFLWYEYRITGQYKDYMDNYIAKGTNYKYYNPITNEDPNHIQDSLILAGVYYDENLTMAFKDRQKPSISPQLLNNKERRDHLKEIAKIFNKHHTQYKIIISPLYDQVKLNPEDYNILCEIFGKENIYDFSGVNRWTSDYHNYYELSHYRSPIAAQIMDIIYSN